MHYHNYINQHVGVSTKLNNGTRLVSYDDSRINTATNIVAAVLSSVIPVLTIPRVELAYDCQLRIGMTLDFTAIFTAILRYFSAARRVEMFVATATQEHGQGDCMVNWAWLADMHSSFAAVDAVFISLLSVAAHPECQQMYQVTR